MDKKRIKILVLPSDRSGVGKYRSTAPHLHLEKMFPDEFSVDIEYEPQLDNDEWLSQYDIIHYHRQIGSFETTKDVLDRLDRLNIISIMDLDDYWAPGPHHPAYLTIKSHEIDKKIVNNLRLAKNITTTTDIFAKEISKLNKNVFVLPNAIDPNEKQFQITPIKSNRIRVGYLGGSCYDDKTEILTDNGFKLFKDLDKTEKVATLNPITNEIEYQQPLNYIAEPYSGLLNCAKTKFIDYAVTPNHNMYCSEAKVLGHKKLNLSLIKSEDIHGKNFHVKRDGVWVGKEEKFFKLPKLTLNKNLPNLQELIDLINKDDLNLINKNEELFLKYKNVVGRGIFGNNNEEKSLEIRCSVKGKYYIYPRPYNLNKYGEDRYLDMDKWLEFFGFWIAEGWTTKSKNLEQVGVCQSKGNEYLSRMFDLLTEMGFNPKYTKDKKQIRIFDKQVWTYLSQFGGAHDKHIPKYIFDLSPRQIKIFFDWFVNGDGSRDTSSGKYLKTTCYSSSKNLIDGLQELALKMGLVTGFKNRGKRHSIIRDRYITNVKDSLELTVSSKGKYVHTTPLVRSEEQFTKQYDGLVYCVEVPNHILLVRRNGKIFWCGNSHRKDLELLGQMVSKLNSEKLLDKIQFVACGFDTRGVVTTIDPITKKEIGRRDSTPMESVWIEYEKIFTNNYTTISPEYKAHLMSFNKNEFVGIENEPYRRVWTKDVNAYASNYNLFDISLAPIESNIFNAMKSNLKVIESGFFKKPIIASNYGPYKIDLIDAFVKGGTFNENGNGFLVNNNDKDWVRYIKMLVNNPEKIELLGNNLYNTVKDLYCMDNVTKDRRELYNKLLNK